MPAKNFSPSKIKNIKQDKIYKSFNNKSEMDLLDYFEDKDIHCVKCKVEMVADPDIMYPVNNKLSLTILRADETIITAVPYFQCNSCKYNNSVLKLLGQTL